MGVRNENSHRYAAATAGHGAARTVVFAALSAWSVVGLTAVSAWAEQDPIATERSLLDVIQAGRVQEREAEGGRARGAEEEEGQAEPEGKAGGQEPKRSWAILPEIGLSPEKGANGGIKFKDRDITPLRLARFDENDPVKTPYSYGVMG